MSTRAFTPRALLRGVPLCLCLASTASAAACHRSVEQPRSTAETIADADVDAEVDVTAPPRANIRAGRVRNYQPAIDYFPEKTAFRYSQQVGIEYHANYKVLTITPAPNPKEQFRYLLVQRGTPAPRLEGNVKTIEVPVRNFILTHEELLGAAEIVGLADKLIAVSTIRGIRAPGIRAGIDAGRIVAVGSGKHVDVERAIQLQPDVALTYWSVNPSYDAHPVLNQAGIRTVVLASHWETSILAVAEWMKVMAVLFNREREANEVFDAIAGRYEALAARARAQPTKPVLLTRLPFRHIWYVIPEPAEIADAGGRYFWPGETRPKGVDIEAVAEKGRDAAAWIIAFPTPIRTLDELLAREPRLSVFDAVRAGQVWNYDLPEVQTNPPYNDRRMRPDLVLADLVKILHPELVPDHEFVFYRQLDAARVTRLEGTRQ
jgi:iron complex transport system substrate-binding protein